MRRFKGGLSREKTKRLKIKCLAIARFQLCSQAQGSAAIAAVGHGLWRLNLSERDRRQNSIALCTCDRVHKAFQPADHASANRGTNGKRCSR
jgi:hypothetical protein